MPRREGEVSSSTNRKDTLVQTLEIGISECWALHEAPFSVSQYGMQRVKPVGVAAKTSSSKHREPAGQTSLAASHGSHNPTPVGVKTSAHWPILVPQLDAPTQSMSTHSKSGSMSTQVCVRSAISSPLIRSQVETPFTGSATAVVSHMPWSAVRYPDGSIRE